MNILKKILEKLKNIFVKKKEIVMIEEGREDFKDETNNFRETLKIKLEKISKSRKKVESHICYGDGLGIKKKIEY